MYMTTYEIVKNYGEAKDKKAQIKILADLNDVAPSSIEELLKNNGIPLPWKADAIKKRRLPKIRTVWDEKNLSRLYEYVKEGLSLVDIGERFGGVDASAISKQISKHNLREKAFCGVDRSFPSVEAIDVVSEKGEFEKRNEGVSSEDYEKLNAKYEDAVLKLKEYEDKYGKIVDKYAGDIKRLESELREAKENAYLMPDIEEVKYQASVIKGLSFLALKAIEDDNVSFKAVFSCIAESSVIILDEIEEGKAV